MLKRVTPMRLRVSLGLWTQLHKPSKLKSLWSCAFFWTIWHIAQFSGDPEISPQAGPMDPMDIRNLLLKSVGPTSRAETNTPKSELGLGWSHLRWKHQFPTSQLRTESDFCRKMFSDCVPTPNSHVLGPTGTLNTWQIVFTCAFAI